MRLARKYFLCKFVRKVIGLVRKTLDIHKCHTIVMYKLDMIKCVMRFIISFTSTFYSYVFVFQISLYLHYGSGREFADPFIAKRKK